MAAATLDQILTSLNGVYNPQIQSVQAQQAALPAQAQAQTQGIEAQKNDAFNSILNGARARGTGVAFGGIPLQEQAQYTASTYAPAMANLQATQNQQQQSLTDALNKINEDKMNTANGMYQFGQTQDMEQQKLAEQQREFDASLAAKNAAGNGLGADFSGLGNYGGGAGPQGGGATAAKQAQMIQRADKGFNYTDQNGNPINAAQYAHLTGQNFRDVLQVAANHGDAGSKAALQFVGNDFGYNPNLVTSPQLAALYHALTGQNAAVKQAPGPSVHNEIMSGFNHLLNNNIFTGYNNSSSQQALARQKAAHGGRI